MNNVSDLVLDGNATALLLQQIFVPRSQRFDARHATA